jgi:MFS transporter, ACS family, tartrate transporter
VTLEERAFRKATRRLVPFLFLIYVVSYLDRVNVSFAQLQLEDDLGFSDTIFGLGAGIFSLGYVIFGVPSNLALARFGARRWLGAIMIAWGVISASMMFIDGPGSFYALRFLLGAAEAGFFPGIILFLTWWFPERQRTPALALFLTGVSVAYVFGGPISGGLLELDSFAGLDGWQWLFLIEGLPAIALGFVTLRFLRSERPEEADWLEPEEREFLVAEVRREQELRERLGPERVRDALGDARVWGFGLVNFVLLAAGFGLTFFVPDLVQDRTGYTDFEVGVLAAIPFAFATAAMIAASRRPGGIAPLMVTGAVGTLITAYSQSPLLLTLGITLAAVGLLAALPRFWIGPTALMSGTAAAAGIALVAVLGNLGGFVGPAFTGIASDSSGGYELPLTVLAGLLLVTAAMRSKQRVGEAEVELAAHVGRRARAPEAAREADPAGHADPGVRGPAA